MTMVRGLLCLGILLLGAAAAGAQETTALAADEARAIRAVIQSQLEAFRRDDGAAAFAHASPGIRDRFGSAETFMAMVRQGYAPVYRPREVEFLEAALRGGTPIQSVRFVGPDGASVVALYAMEQQPDGTWRISAVYLLRSDEVAS